MPSTSLQQWRTQALEAEKDLEANRKAVRGKRWAVQVNHNHTAMLSSYFQAFARGLHSEGVNVLVNQANPSFRIIFRMAMTAGRALDYGNPNERSLVTDFERIGLAPFMKTMKAHDKRNAARFEKLRTLMTWRNAIAHQDWTKVPNQDPNLPLLQVKKWRSACNGLATSMDEVLREYLTQVVGVSPW